jgi:hypothetical protein
MKVKRTELALVALTALALLVAGCPRDVAEPSPSGGEPCNTIADCNMDDAGARAAMRACVDGRCERDASIAVP